MKVSIVTLALSTVVAVNDSFDSEIFSTADKSFRTLMKKCFNPKTATLDRQNVPRYKGWIQT